MFFIVVLYARMSARFYANYLIQQWNNKSKYTS